MTYALLERCHAGQQHQSNRFGVGQSHRHVQVQLKRWVMPGEAVDDSAAASAPPPVSRAASSSSMASDADKWALFSQL